MGLDWPTGWDRTPATRREDTAKFEKARSQTFEELTTLLERLGVDEWRLSTDVAHQTADPQKPYASRTADDPGVVLRWTVDGRDHAVACDAWTTLDDNLREVYRYVVDKRRIGNRPVTTGEDEFANARLPAGDEDDVVAGEAPPHEILDVAPDAPEAVVKGAARSLKAETHPDRGGSEAAFQRVVAAEEAMLDE